MTIDLALRGHGIDEWHIYIGKLCFNFIKLSEEIKDTLCWSKNPSTKYFKAMLGYKAQA
jgi:hypothetical protein